MWELYLISRIGIIHQLFLTATILSIITAVICYFVSILHDDWGEACFNKRQILKLRKFANKMLIVFGFSVLIVVVTPTKEDAYFIYGVGGTIDYIQSNPKAKQIPDKCIDALNKWVDNLNEKEEKK